MSLETREALGRIAILLHDVHIGDIAAFPDDRTEFAFTSGYLDSFPRPVLGQAFEDDLRTSHRARMRLPPFFSNLLPEDRLRELTAEQIGVAPEREARLLAYLGDDLPGAVRAVPEGELPPVSSTSTEPSAPEHAHPIKFSLAGMQPKASMLREGRGLTFPATGRGGDWIVKLPSQKWGGVPENEFLTMSWARAAGIHVPETLLVPAGDLENLPPGLRAGGGAAYAIRRYDRLPGGGRVHAEDFAQVLGLYPTQREKYGKANYEALGRVLWALHPPSFEDYIRRLVFVVLSANGDAHVKNWSLWYPDRVRPELAPAYDLVSTVEFIPNDGLALNLGGSKAFDTVRLDSFAAMAARTGAEPDRVRAVAREAVQRTHDMWSGVAQDASGALRAALERHWSRLPLVAEAR